MPVPTPTAGRCLLLHRLGGLPPWEGRAVVPRSTARPISADRPGTPASCDQPVNHRPDSAGSSTPHRPGWELTFGPCADECARWPEGMGRRALPCMGRTGTLLNAEPPCSIEAVSAAKVAARGKSSPQTSARRPRGGACLFLSRGNMERRPVPGKTGLHAHRAGMFCHPESEGPATMPFPTFRSPDSSRRPALQRHRDGSELAAVL
jgi:hypothetical protein